MLTAPGFISGNTAIDVISDHGYGGGWNDAIDLWVVGVGHGTVQYKITNNSNINTLKMALFVTNDLREGENFYNTISISDAINAIPTTISNKPGATIELSPGQSAIVTLVLATPTTSLDYTRVRFSPFYNGGFVGTFTVEDILLTD